MGPIAVRRQLRRHRPRIAVIATILLCSTAIAVHHTGLAMGQGHHEMSMTTAVEMCVAAFSAVGAAVIAVALGLITLGRWRPSTTLSPTSLWFAPSPPLPRARAGPALLLLLCVDQR